MEATKTHAPKRANEKMKAIAQTKYGSPDVLSLQEFDKPVIRANEVLVKIIAASVNAGDWHLMRGEPFLARFMFGGILKPTIPILGFDLAGRVEAVGKDVTEFHPGDEVFGDLSDFGFGAFAEYVAAPEAALVLKPGNISFEQAASVPGAGITALQGLRNLGQIQAGQKVLINGASGGVGSFAVQIAKAFGAEVTAVCSTKKMDAVRSLGADAIVDYTKLDICQQKQYYDLILDVAAYRSVFDYLPTLKPGGSYVLVGGSTARLFQVMFLGSLIAKISRRQVKCLVLKPNRADIVTLRELLVSGKISPLIDRCYKLSEVPAAISYVEDRKVVGKVVITV